MTKQDGMVRRVRWSTCTVVQFTVVADASKLPSDGVGVGLGCRIDVRHHSIDDFECCRVGERLAVDALRLTACQRREMVGGAALETVEQRPDLTNGNGHWIAMSSAELDELEAANECLLRGISSDGDGGSGPWASTAGGGAHVNLYSTAAPDEERDGSGGGFRERDASEEEDRKRRLDEERERTAARKVRRERCSRCHRASCLC